MCMHLDRTKLAEDLLRELRDLLNQRRMIDMRLGQVNMGLRSLAEVLPDKRDEILRELKESTRKPAGLTEAISEVLNHTSGSLTAKEVKEQLKREGFDLSEYTQPLAVIYTTLTRLSDSGRVKVSKNKGKRYYRWNQ